MACWWPPARRRRRLLRELLDADARDALRAVLIILNAADSIAACVVAMCANTARSIQEHRAGTDAVLEVLDTAAKRVRHDLCPQRRTGLTWSDAVDILDGTSKQLVQYARCLTRPAAACKDLTAHAANNLCAPRIFNVKITRPCVYDAELIVLKSTFGGVRSADLTRDSTVINDNQSIPDVGEILNSTDFTVDVYDAPGRYAHWIDVSDVCVRITAPFWQNDTKWVRVTLTGSHGAFQVHVVLSRACVRVAGVVSVLGMSYEYAFEAKRPPPVLHVDICTVASAFGESCTQRPVCSENGDLIALPIHVPSLRCSFVGVCAYDKAFLRAAALPSMQIHRKHVSFPCTRSVSCTPRGTLMFQENSRVYEIDLAGNLLHCWPGLSVTAFAVRGNVVVLADRVPRGAFSAVCLRVYDSCTRKFIGAHAHGLHCVTNILIMHDELRVMYSGTRYFEELGAYQFSDPRIIALGRYRDPAQLSFRRYKGFIPLENLDHVGFLLLDMTRAKLEVHVSSPGQEKMTEEWCAYDVDPICAKEPPMLCVTALARRATLLFDSHIGITPRSVDHLLPFKRHAGLENNETCK